MQDERQTVSRRFLPALGMAVRALRARIDRSLQRHGLRIGQFQILTMLWEQDGLTPRELAEGLSVEMPTITRTVQRMLRDGLVRRAANPADARSVHITLTNRGREIRDSVSGVLEEETSIALASFSAPEREAFVGFLERVSRNARGE